MIFFSLIFFVNDRFKKLETSMNNKFDNKLKKVEGINDILDNHIIDFKTGANPLSQKEADRDLQLSIYALAGTMIPEYPFNRDAENVRLSLYYFDNPQIVTTIRTSKQLEEAKKMILSYKKQIEESDFKCSGNKLCDKCEYKLFCTTESD